MDQNVFVGTVGNFVCYVPGNIYERYEYIYFIVAWNLENNYFFCKKLHIHPKVNDLPQFTSKLFVWILPLSRNIFSGKYNLFLNINTEVTMVHNATGTSTAM